MATHAHSTPVRLLNPDGTFNKSAIMRRAAVRARADRAAVEARPRQSSFRSLRPGRKLPWAYWISAALKTVWMAARLERSQVPVLAAPVSEAALSDQREAAREFMARRLAQMLADRAAKAERCTYTASVRHRELRP